jgi:hypothetical protein
MLAEQLFVMGKLAMLAFSACFDTIVCERTRSKLLRCIGYCWR